MKIGVIGTGRMGIEISNIIKADENLSKVELLTDLFSDNEFEFEETPDCILDASHPANLDRLIAYAKANKVPCVIATTNYTDQQIAQIEELGTVVPVLRSTNFSIGVAILNKLVDVATSLMKEDFDIEIIEKHHNRKIDAPSGTAKTLFNTINKDNDFNPVYERSGVSPREKNDVGILALRGGTIFGEHSVNYCGTNEVIEISHTAYSRSIFAGGMIKAAKWIVDKSAALYNINDLLFKEEN